MNRGVLFCFVFGIVCQITVHHFGSLGWKPTPKHEGKNHGKILFPGLPSCLVPVSRSVSSLTQPRCTCLGTLPPSAEEFPTSVIIQHNLSLIQHPDMLMEGHPQVRLPQRTVGSKMLRAEVNWDTQTIIYEKVLKTQIQRLNHINHFSSKTPNIDDCNKWKRHICQEMRRGNFLGSRKLKLLLHRKSPNQ